METIKELAVLASVYAIVVIIAVYGIEFLKKKYESKKEDSIQVDGKFIEERFEKARLHDIVIRQMWVENEKVSVELTGEFGNIGPDIMIDKKDAFACGFFTDWQNDNEMERCAIFFIRKGVKAHYDELRQQSGEQTDHLKHKEQ